MKRFLNVLLVPLVLAAFPSLTRADHSWGNYHWARTGNPFNLNLGNNVSSAWRPYLVTASSDWTASSVLNTTIVTGGTTNDPKKCRPTNGRVEVCSANYGGAWLGLAQIWASGSHITQATAKMNDFYFNKPKYNTEAWRNLVMCQEVGHTLGLDHQDENFSNVPLGTCMDYSNDPNPNQHPNAHDYQQLETIYAHLDNPASTSQTSARGALPPAMTDIDFEGPGQWGRLIRSTHGDRRQLFELDFGGGHKIFTFVIWADEEDGGRGKRH